MTYAKRYARPFAEIAFIAASTVLALASAPAASAQTTSFEARFTYNPEAPAEAIYAKLERTAQFACESPGVRGPKFRRDEQACAARLLNDVVARIGRPDIAGVHQSLNRIEVAGN